MSDDRPSVYLEEGVPIYRASSLGNCPRALLAARKGILPDEHQFSSKTLQIMEEGNLHEPFVLQRLADEYGIETAHEQELVELPIRILGEDTPLAIIRGHIDALSDNAVVEVKTMSQNAYEQWLRRRWDAQPGYAWQLSVYMVYYNLPGILVAKNRNTGEMDVWDIAEPMHTEGDIYNRIVSIENAIHDPVTVFSCHGESTWKCNYPSIHDGYIAEPQVDSPNDPQAFNDLCHQYQVAKDREAYYASIKEGLKEELFDLLASPHIETDKWDAVVRESTSSRLDVKKVRAYLKKQDDAPEFDLTSTSTTLTIKEKK